MKEQRNGMVRKLKKHVTAFMCICMLGLLIAVNGETEAYGEQAGTYLVTVTPSYRDPETGSIEDPGNNEAIGQGMTEKLCGSSGLLEIEASGDTYLTVRYYLSQFVSSVSFEERSGGSYSTLFYEEMQIREPVEGAVNIDDKYGYTDYRMKVTGMDSVFRGKAYIEPMGRSVVYFFSISNPLPGSGDFITSAGQTSSKADLQTSGAESQDEAGQKVPEAETVLESAARGGEAKEEGEEESSGAMVEFDIGGGEEDDPVTGIPEKLSASQEVLTQEEPSEYHLETSYDLSKVPLEEARKLTDPILKEAVGITGMTEDIEQEQPGTLAASSGSRTVMQILLGAAAVLLVRFGAASIRGKKREGRRDRQ
ncbi:heme-binding Shp domain-containing protein [Lachnospiraceae bacterium 54-53]